eukprot:TCONS_00019191-protein
MNVEITESISLPISKSSFLPLDSSNGYAAFSTPLVKGIQLKRISNAIDFQDLEEQSDNKDSNKEVSFKLNNVHPSGVQFVCFGNQNGPLVFASACSDEVNIWNLDLTGRTKAPEPLTIAENLGCVSCMAFSKDDQHLAICISNEIWVINTLNSELVVEFSASQSFIFLVGFCLTIEDMLISIAEDRTYCIWDVGEKEQLYQSTIISSFQFQSLAVHPLESYFATGSEDGMLRVFDMTLHSSLHEVNILQLLNKDFDNITECSVLSLKYWKRKASFAQSKLAEELYLAIGCHLGFLIFNANSMEVIYTFLFDYEIHDNGLSNQYKAFQNATQIDFSAPIEQNRLTVGVLSPSNKLYFFLVEPDLEDLNLALELLAVEPLQKDSPLKNILVPKPIPDAKPKIAKAKSSNRPTKQKVDKMNQPVVFKKKVASSGYTASKPRNEMFKPQTNASKTKKSAPTGKTSKTDRKNPVGPWGLKTEPRSLQEDYPKDSEPTIHLIENKQLTEKPIPINDMSFSDTGKSLACALSDNSLLLCKGKSLNTHSTFQGHTGVLNSCSIGHQNGYLATASADSTVKLWSVAQTELLMTMTHLKHNFKQDNNVKNEIKRYQNNCRYKLVKDFEVEDTQNITTFSAINTFYSYKVICACSNRSLAIFDMNKGEEVQTIKDAHTRPVHSVSQIQGSTFIGLPSESYELFVTSAPHDGVKLWDTRTYRSVRKYEGHVNRSQKVGLAVSPCAKYIAVGSEDKSVYIYDIRSNSYLHSLPGHKDNVSALAYHPQKPTLACGTLSGSFRLYSDAEKV